MRTFGQTILGIIIGIALLIGGSVVLYPFAYPTYTFRYRMTVEVEDGGKIHSNSSVIEVRLAKQPPLLVPAPPVTQKLLGEAVYVDLGEGRNVTALLASGVNASDVDYPVHIVPAHFNLSYEDGDLRKYPQLTGRWELDGLSGPAGLPTFVTLTDPNDPKSAHVLSPDEFGQVFGPKVRLQKAWIEMTTDPITKGIESKLPWLAHTERYRTNPTNPFTSTLSFGRHLFIRE